MQAAQHSSKIFMKAQEQLKCTPLNNKLGRQYFAITLQAFSLLRCQLFLTLVINWSLAGSFYAVLCATGGGFHLQPSRMPG